jgi:hypothetical protein
MHGLGPRGARRGDDLLLIEIALRGGGGAKGHRLVGLQDVERLAISVREDGDSADAELATGPDHPNSDLSAIGDEDFRKGRRHERQS